MGIKILSIGLLSVLCGLTDDIIDAAQNTLQEQFGVLGLQSVVKGQGCNFDMMTEEFVQIHHSGKSHWVTISTIGAKTH